jgi:hypothetical protein
MVRTIDTYSDPYFPGKKKPIKKASAKKQLPGLLQAQ